MTCPRGSWPTACPPGWPGAVNRARPISEPMRLNRHRRRSAVNSLVRPGRAGRKRAAAPEDHLPDRTPEPAEGERQRYPLPNEYGPARPPLGNDDDLFDDDIPTVTLHERDA